MAPQDPPLDPPLTSPSKVEWRKQQLRDLLSQEFASKDPPLLEDQKQLLTTLVEE